MEATNRWNNKLEGQQLMLMDAKLRLQQHDVDGALSILIKIPPDQQNYSIARMQMADIYLNYKKDKKKFVECYRFVPTYYILFKFEKKFFYFF